MDGSEKFTRKWADYVAGFGNISTEFWLGLENIHCLTSRTPRSELRVELADFKGNYKYTHYGFFNVNDASTNYTLDIADHQFRDYYNEKAPDQLTYHNGMQFSTRDRDNDKWSKNCTGNTQGAWWYKNCSELNLNGRYRSGKNWGTLSWAPLADGAVNAMKYTQMKIRPHT